ncbi:hypothetical protein GCM10028807_04820 [Spirosoma daeguense]
MKKRLLFCAFIGSLTACQHTPDIQPNLATPASEAVGTYQSNFFLDPSSVDLPSSQMPYVQLKAESDSQVTLTYTKLYPARTDLSVKHVSVIRQNDTIRLRLGNSDIGTLLTDRAFTSNGMEKQGKLLRLTHSQSSLSFTGLKQ